MKRWCILLALGTACGLALDIPRTGFVRDEQGKIYAIDGVASAFIARPATTSDPAEAFAWNGVLGVRKDETSLQLWDDAGAAIATYEAPSGHAVIGFDRSGELAAFVFVKGEVLDVTRGALRHIPVSIEGTVLAIAGDRLTVDIAVREKHQLFVVTLNRVTGDQLSKIALNINALQVLLLNDGSIAGIAGSTICVLRPDGSQWSTDSGVELTGLNWMGREWLHVASAGQQFGLRIRPSTEPFLYYVPQAATQ